MTPIAVLVHGALGKMGQQVLSALCRDPELEPIAAVDLRADQGYLSLPDGSREIPLSSQLEPVIVSWKPDVLVDFSTAAAVISATELDEMEQFCREYDIGAIVASNFSLGAVLMVQLAKVAAKFFDHAEVIEMHHEQKADAPSGTAITTAREMTEARGKAFAYSLPEKESLAGSRGAQYQGVALHSLRMPGLLAHQEVVLGGAGETLRIRHDTISRECYMPGVILAIKEVGKIKGLVRGLDKLLHF
jgi:4-hydroxy-tetrahydrodipicolinate reductase